MGKALQKLTEPKLQKLRNAAFRFENSVVEICAKLANGAEIRVPKSSLTFSRALREPPRSSDVEGMR